MAVGDIFQRFFKKNAQDVNFLSLTLTFDSILASVWTFDNDAVKITGFAKRSFQNVENLIHQAAVAIDAAAEKAGSDVSQVVFGLSANWFEGSQLTTDTSKLLKKLSSDLELDAQAYVSLSASIKNYLKVREGSTPNIVLLGIFQDYFEVHLIRNNQVDSTKTSKSKPTLEKISSLVKQLDNEQSLPAKIHIFGLGQDTSLADQIQKDDFKDVFVQQPKIEFIKDSELSFSVAASQATDILGHEPQLTLKSSTSVQKIADIDSYDIMQKTPIADELGFIEGEDVLEIGADFQGEKQPEPLTADIPSSKANIATRQVDENFEHQIQDEMPTAGNLIKQDKVQTKSSQGIIEQITTLSWMSKILDLLKGRNAFKKIAISLGLILVLSLLGLFILGKTIASAEVVIKISAQSKDDNFDVDVLVGGSPDFSKDQIAGRKVEGEAQGTRKAVATGKKKVGEYAKGQVTVFNWTGSPKNFPKGTEIISKSGLKFTFEDTVEATSASAPSASERNPGKADVKVSAKEVGPDYNLGANQDFVFSQFDELFYSATNETAFSGGDEKEVTIASRDDLNNLQESLHNSLKETAVNDLKNKLAGTQFHDETIETSIAKKSFDKKLDEEASLINLDLVVTATAIVYDESSLKELLAQSINSQAPQNMESKPENIEILSVNAKKRTGGLNLSGKFQARFVPKFNEEELKEKLSAKSVKESREIIKELPEVVDVKVNFSPSFVITNSLPKSLGKINIKIET